jgi:hypothetical protein
MNKFLNQHRAIEVLLGRYVRRNRANGRITLDGFVNYLRNHRDVKSSLKNFGRHRLRRVVSHALESGAYGPWRLSKGNGIVGTDFKKQLRESNFNPTTKQRRSLGIN